ncbi:MAG: bifunctional ornithine acetyltransferase/N-acetylglutamate synthase [Methanotrichaceae archaeon]|nr:bifunctional ornithine acetyltransferase/N-acetylglutamate synthase [Methanotrichaceae archaeon]
MQRIDGGICAVPGVKAAGAREGKYGVAVIIARGQAAGMYTTNRVKAAPLEVTARHLEGGLLEGIVANSGCANAYTGARGEEDAQAMAGLLAGFLGSGPERIAVASTGVIGRYLDMALIKRLFDEATSRLRSDPEASSEAARAIMTTDTRVKEIAVEHRGVRVGGIVKGSGMIEPHLATMFGFIFTDADFEAPVLNECLKDAVRDSFNMLTVDGDTSTNDIVLLTATGARKCELSDFSQALRYVCTELARMMARDGEGASKYFETVIRGARTEEDARLAARSVARSSLVKTAVYGADPNWGRIIAAVGYSGADVDPKKITLALEGSGRKATLVERGKIVDGVLEEAQRIMKEESITIDVDLGLGTGAARAFGCDLTHGYVDINANYTT